MALAQAHSRIIAGQHERLLPAHIRFDNVLRYIFFAVLSVAAMIGPFEPTSLMVTYLAIAALSLHAIRISLRAWSKEFVARIGVQAISISCMLIALRYVMAPLGVLYQGTGPLLTLSLLAVIQ